MFTRAPSRQRIEDPPSGHEPSMAVAGRAAKDWLLSLGFDRRMSAGTDT
jgi:hypothetical protein